MKITQQTGRIIGVLLILMFIAGATSLNLIGLSYNMAESPDFLATIYDNSSKMKLGVLVDFLAGLIGGAIVIFLFPVLKRVSLSIAYWVLGLWIIQYCIAGIGSLNQLSLLSTSEAYNTTQDNIEIYNAIGALDIQNYFWAHFIGLLVFAMGYALLYYGLLRSKLIPSWLAIWGIGAVSTVFIATLFNVYEYDVSFYFYMQNGLHLITFSIWLLVKGFNNKALEETS